MKLSNLLIKCVLLPLVLSASGCVFLEKEIDWQERLANSVDPVNSLQADALSTVYTREFWARQKQDKTPAWKYAIAFCVSHTDYPNCDTVTGLMQ